MLTITDKELNKAYKYINDSDKENIDKTIPYIIFVGDKELQFKYDYSVGRKGAWILDTKVDVTFDDDTDDYDPIDNLEYNSL